VLLSATMVPFSNFLNLSLQRGIKGVLMFLVIECRKKRRFLESRRNDHGGGRKMAHDSNTVTCRSQADVNIARHWISGACP
jgi:hypothetical protein